MTFTQTSAYRALDGTDAAQVSAYFRDLFDRLQGTLPKDHHGRRLAFQQANDAAVGLAVRLRAERRLTAEDRAHLSDGLETCRLMGWNHDQTCDYLTTLLMEDCHLPISEAALIAFNRANDGSPGA